MNKITCSPSTNNNNNVAALAALIDQRYWIVCAIFLIGLFMQPVMLHGEEVIDHLFDYIALINKSDLNGIGQTFVAPDSLLTDATFLIVEPSHSLPSFSWWDDAHFEVRHGLPGNFYGNSGNILFRSEKVDFNLLPILGTSRFGNRTLYGLSLSQWGLDAPLSINPGETYSLILINYGSSGYISYAEHQPSSYASGGTVGHNVAYSDDFWAGPYNFVDLAFRVTTIPEPSTLALLGISGISLLAYAWRRRK
jgi:hypothetical protein